MRKLTLLIVLIGIIFAIRTVWFAAEPIPSEPGAATLPGSSRLAELLGDADNAFPMALESRPFAFPADHGPHPRYRNEWWYVTGNLDADRGERVGFELTLFRFALAPDPVVTESAWRSNQVYIGHFAITDVAGQRFHVAERYARGALGLAGATASPTRVWLEDWQITRDVDWRIEAGDETIAIDLTLTEAKSPVLNGVDGLSQKSAEPGNASYYYSIPRLTTEGTVRIGDRTMAVSGLSWLDREWGSSALSRQQVGWDWFALQLDDGSELMFYDLRLTDGGRDPMSAGTYVAADGGVRHLLGDEVGIEVRDHWDSPAGGRYPSAWRLTVPSLGLTLDVEPVMAAQELATNVRYWEGAVDVVGQRGAQVVGGRGYVELTGYAGT